MIASSTNPHIKSKNCLKLCLISDIYIILGIFIKIKQLKALKLY